jgi:putative copper resistance protein D
MALTSSRSAPRRRIVDRRSAEGKSARSTKVLLFVGGTVVAGVAALSIALWLGGDLSQSVINGLVIGGTSDLTGWGLPASKLVMEVSSVGVIGMLLGCLLLPQEDDGPSPTAQRCLRTASWLALAWAISTAMLLLFSWSDVIAQPVTQLSITRLFTDTATTFPGAADFVSSIAVALVIAVAVKVTAARWAMLLLLVLACYNLVPMALQGHASHGEVLKYSLIVHVIAVSLWVGGLTALVMHARAEPAQLAVALPRFSVIALGCYIAVAASGSVAVWKLLGAVPALWGSRYGVLVLLKATALIILGILGWWHRRHTVGRISVSDEDGWVRRAFIRLAAAEIVVMVVAVAIAVALSRTASPDTIVLHGNQ